MDDLGTIINEILAGCADREMQPPFIMCSVSPNGSVYVVRVKGDGTPPETLAQHFENEGFALPMTVAVVDQRNEAVKITIAASGQRGWH